MTAGLFRTGVLSVAVLLLTMAAAAAQAPAAGALAPQPVTGFVSPYEIVETVRAAGFDPLAPPLREGTSYVLRATDFRGILMRVVVDARTGAIRDVTRIVPGPGRFGEVPPPYGPPPLLPADLDALAPGQDSELSRPSPARLASPAFAVPLPRPRPAASASRNSGDSAGGADTSPARAAPAAGNSGLAMPVPAAPQKPPAVSPPIND